MKKTPIAEYAQLKIVWDDSVRYPGTYGESRETHTFLTMEGAEKFVQELQERKGKETMTLYTIQLIRMYPCCENDPDSKLYYKVEDSRYWFRDEEETE